MEQAEAESSANHNSTGNEPEENKVDKREIAEGGQNHGDTIYWPNILWDTAPEDICTACLRLDPENIAAYDGSPSDDVDDQENHLLSSHLLPPHTAMDSLDVRNRETGTNPRYRRLFALADVVCTPVLRLPLHD